MAKTYRILLAAMLIFIACDMNAQSSKESRYLFHFNPFNQVQPSAPKHGRTVKVLFDMGLVSQFYNTDPHYTTGTTANGSYTIGLKLSIPVLQNGNILIGGEYMNHNFNFYSYYFAPGYSFLYDGNEIYNHAIEMDELHIPIQYKINFNPEARKVKTFYATIGWIYRYMFYDNSLITNSNNGKFVWEGQGDITTLFQLFGPTGSSAMEISLGYQHNRLSNGNAWFFEIEYKYGFSPYLYAGNNNGSNSVQFTLNSLSFKLGLRL
jgi:hypothetical protein